MNEEQCLVRKEHQRSGDEQLEILSAATLTDLIDEMSRDAFARKLARRAVRKTPESGKAGREADKGAERAADN